MNVTNISTGDLKRMNNKEGLILLGCGGEISDWVNGINNELTKENILLDGTKFENVSVFSFKEGTCILYPFDDKVKLDVGKLSIWRIRTHEAFGGTWLTDFVNNELGGFDKRELTTGQAVRFSDSQWYLTKTAEEISAMQLFEPKLIVPKFDIFHEAMEKALGIPVQTIEFGLGLDYLKKQFMEKVPNAEELIAKMEAEKQAFINLADHDKIYFHNEKLKGMLGDIKNLEIHYSGDFQCDQTGGYPTMLCACFEKEIAWLEPNTRIADENTNIHKIRGMCADFGIKKCVDPEQYNGILKDLGEDAYDTAFIPTDDGGQVQSL